MQLTITSEPNEKRRELKMGDRVSKVITSEPGESIHISFDMVRFSIIQKLNINLARVIVLNPREAQEIADFVNENNLSYQDEQAEKKLLENIERLA